MPIKTPDERYIIVRGQLWRTSNPALAEPDRRALVIELMAARRAIKDAKGDADVIAKARSCVHAAKLALGERGPVWWTDGAPDENRTKIENSSYANWWSLREQNRTE